MNDKTLAIVPARGGSKGIPRKNLRLLAGRPLLAYTLEHAVRAQSIDRIVVSTDDSEIAELARGQGCQVVRRPARLAGDTATSESALLHVLDELRDNERYEPDLVVFLQATSPMRRPNDIDRAIARLEKTGADSLFSASALHGFVWRQRGAEVDSLTYDYRARRRRQDFDSEEFLENGSIYVFKPWVLRQYGNRLGGTIAIYPMHPLDSFQVDETSDLDLLERLMELPESRIASEPPDDRRRRSLRRVQLLILDFDGVLTDNRVIVHQDGSEAVRCDRGDGLGIAMLLDRGTVEAMVLSKETNPVVAERCRKLRLPCIQGCDDKLAEIERIASERDLAPAQIAYLGNDVNDLEAMAWCGVAIAVADAVSEVRAAADLVTRRPGGQGAVREICDLLLAPVAEPGIEG